MGTDYWGGLSLVWPSNPYVTRFDILFLGEELWGRIFILD